MAQYKIPEPDDDCLCPYDVTHIMPRKRLQYHLIKCRKNHPTADMAVCRFNNLHVVPRVELRYHMSKCPDRALLEQDIVHQQSLQNDDGAGEYFHGDCSVPPYTSPYQNLTKSEDWDRECDYEIRRQNMIAEAEQPSRLPYDLPAPVVDQTNSVFSYSLSMSGVGRGKPPTLPAQTTHSAAATPTAGEALRGASSENTSLLQTLARGRGVGVVPSDSQVQATPVVGLIRQQTPPVQSTSQPSTVLSTPTHTLDQAPPTQPMNSSRGRRGGVCGSPAFRLSATNPRPESGNVQKAEFVVPKVPPMTNGTLEQ